MYLDFSKKLKTYNYFRMVNIHPSYFFAELGLRFLKSKM